MRLVLSVLMLTGLLCTESIGAQSNAMIGSFLVTTEKDPFDESSTVVAMAIANGGVFALRCIQSTLSVAVATPSRVEQGGTFLVKIRADNKTIFEEPGTAINDKIIEVTEEIEHIFVEVSGAKSVSVRITGASSYTYTVPVLQSAKVVDQVKKACDTKTK